MDRKVSEKTLDKYKLVIDQYFINGFNGTKAYQKFYPDSSDSTAADRFLELGRIGEMESYKKEKQEEVAKILGTSHEQLLNELKRWAYSDITETIMLLPEEVKELPPEIRRLITKFKSTKRDVLGMNGNIVEKIEVIELWFVSKEKAMDMIHKHVGFYAPVQIGLHLNDENSPLFPNDPLSEPK